jgi:hypothetical protein
MTVADHFRLDSGGARDVLAEFTRAVANWRRVVLSHGLLQRELDLTEPAFEHAEAERVRALAGR